MPFAAQIGSVCPLCKEGFVDLGSVSSNRRLLMVFLDGISFYIRNSFGIRFLMRVELYFDFRPI